VNRNLNTVVLTAALALTSIPLASPAVSASSASATFTAHKAKTYKNCDAMHKDYPHGVGKKGAKDKVRGKTAPVTNFKVSNKLFKANKKSDRDGDKIACEHH
jgi:hypothetical protein